MGCPGKASPTALSCLQCCEAIYSSVSGLKAHLASCSKVSAGPQYGCIGYSALLAFSCQESTLTSMIPSPSPCTQAQRLANASQPAHESSLNPTSSHSQFQALPWRFSSVDIHLHCSMVGSVVMSCRSLKPSLSVHIPTMHLCLG